MNFIFLGALNGFLVVALGAFGAHALKDRLEPASLATFETAVRYQAYHAFALLAVGLCAREQPSRTLSWAGGFLALGILLFSGSLYALALTRLRPFGMVTPFGGLALLVGWALFGFQAWRGLS